MSQQAAAAAASTAGVGSLAALHRLQSLAVNQAALSVYQVPKAPPS